MAELKTKVTDQSIEEFMVLVDPKRKEEANELLVMMKSVTGEVPKIWKDVVGFGTYSYKRSDGNEFQWYRTGFAPRKSKITIYIMPGYELKKDLLNKLGKHKVGKSCLYINKLADVDMDVLTKLVKIGFVEMKKLEQND